MGREYQTGAEERLQEAAREVSIPGMAVHDICVGDRPCHHDVAHHRLQKPLMATILRGGVEVRVYALDREILLLSPLIAETQNGHAVCSVFQIGQLTREVFD